jgi:hypothetical protein
MALHSPLDGTGEKTLKSPSKLVWITSFALALAVWPRELDGCSVAMCAGRGVEMEANVGVVVKLGRNGVQGATIEIKASTTDRLFATERTDKSGRVTIKKLPPGDYWISVTYLGVSAGDDCFHVRPRSSNGAKATLRYRWGDYGVPMRSVSGSLEEWQAGQGGTPIWNLAHGESVPIEGATTLLENALTREMLRSQSDAKGFFRFDTVQDGTYVLHIKGGKTARAYAAADMIVPVSHTATRDSVALTLREDGCGFLTFNPKWR